MSKTVKRGSLTLLFVGLAALGALALSGTASSETASREIVLVAEGMAFYLDGASGAERVANPTLTLGRGETVRLVLVNRDAGMEHDWASRGLDAGTSTIPGDGGTTSVRIEAPAEPGRHEYVCSLHARMMRGVIEVR
jgi:plastocyanin